jgi:hypothetical protein
MLTAKDIKTLFAPEEASLKSNTRFFNLKHLFLSKNEIGTTARI